MAVPSDGSYGVPEGLVFGLHAALEPRIEDATVTLAPVDTRHFEGSPPVRAGNVG